jgi:hypothetical protein
LILARIDKRTANLPDCGRHRLQWQRPVAIGAAEFP